MIIVAGIKAKNVPFVGAGHLAVNIWNRGLTSGVHVLISKRMTDMGLDVLVSLGIIAAVIYYAFWKDWLQPILFGTAPKQRQSVKDLPAPRRVQQRSARSARSNALNVRSAQQKAEIIPVERSAERSDLGPNIVDDTQLHISEKELTQLALAFEQLGRGDTEQQALELAFNCSKGGGKAWRRAKALYDLAKDGREG